MISLSRKPSSQGNVVISTVGWGKRANELHDTWPCFECLQLAIVRFPWKSPILLYVSWSASFSKLYVSNFNFSRTNECLSILMNFGWYNFIRGIYLMRIRCIDQKREIILVFIKQKIWPLLSGAQNMANITAVGCILNLHCRWIHCAWKRRTALLFRVNPFYYLLFCTINTWQIRFCSTIFSSLIRKCWGKWFYGRHP